MRQFTFLLLSAVLAFAPAVAFARKSATTMPTMPAATTITTTAPATTAAIPASSTPINVNSASAADLLKIPGINAKIAAEVIKNRPYKDAAELVKKVKGIGPRNVKKMLAFISF